MLPHVVRWNADQVGQRYAELLKISDGADESNAPARLADRLAELASAGGLPATLDQLGVSRGDLASLSADAATQWTGTCNPRPFDAQAALALYEQAY
jgi:alcohol dehydrogenase class IV